MRSTEMLKQEIEQFINGNFSLWEIPITKKLVQAKYQELHITGINDIYAYNTNAALNEQKISTSKQVLARYDDGVIFLEEPDFQNLSDFYQEHGLLPLSEKALVEEQAESKLKSALDVLALVPECIACISLLVNCIQIIWSEGPDYDTSYSHPDIPFTIFVSVCEENTNTSSIRVAESILHEAMHLKLTLIENNLQLIKPFASATLYSPWRGMQRPVRGVLHGLFVFRAIYDYYQAIFKKSINEVESRFVICRIIEIEKELIQTRSLETSQGLTFQGKAIASRLIEIEN
jgi:HEXXH motif-containing protein